MDRLRLMLPGRVRYRHVIYVLPSVLWEIVLQNRQLIGDAMFVAGPETLLALGKSEIGANLAALAFYDTVGRGLSVQFHVHVLVTTGGLTDKGHWAAYRRGEFVDSEAAGRLFRASLIETILGLNSAGRLVLEGSLRSLRPMAALRDFLLQPPEPEWTPHAQRVAGGPGGVLRYFMKAASPFMSGASYRLVSSGVAARRRKGTGWDRPLSAREFLRRAEAHVLPKGFVRTRRFGFIAGPKARLNLDTVRSLLRGKETPMTFLDRTPRRPSTLRLERRMPLGPAGRVRRSRIKSRSPPPPGAELRARESSPLRKECFFFVRHASCHIPP